MIHGRLFALFLVASACHAQCSIEFVPANPSEFQRFGRSVALDGNLAVIGSPTDTAVGTLAGSMYVFRAVDGFQLWYRIGTTTAAGDEFGTSVAIMGNNIFVGAPRNDALGTDSGAVYVFDATNGAQLAILIPSDGSSNDQFGTSLAASAGRVVVGAPRDDDAGNSSGSIYVFDVTNFTEIAKYTAPGVDAGDRFGSSLACDGDRVLVGAPRSDQGGVIVGAAHLIDLTSMTQIDVFRSPDLEADRWFGTSVAMKGDLGVVGAAQDPSMGFAGSAFAIDIDSSTVSRLPAEGPSIDTSVATNGHVIAVGFSGSGQNHATTTDGFVRIFDRSGRDAGTLSREGHGALRPLFGSSLAMVDDVVLVGAFQAENNALTVGAAYTYPVYGFAGTGEDLELRSTSLTDSNPLMPCLHATPGDLINIGLVSNVDFVGFPPALFVQPFIDSSIPESPFGGIALDPQLGGISVLYDGTAMAGSTAAGAFTLPPGGLEVGIVYPAVAPTARFLLQGFALTPTADNLIFASTVGHVLGEF